MNRRQVAAETVEISERGSYVTAAGKVVDLRESIAACIENTDDYEPAELALLVQDVLSQEPRFTGTSLELVNETTLEGSKRLAFAEEFQRIGVLNFASAKNPGGGFLKGSQAQEESLARSSALYQSLLQGHRYYEAHRQQRSCVYSDRMIYSPQCPVFRSDDGALLEEPYLVDFITSPAPNAGVIEEREKRMVAQLPEILKERSSKVLALAAHHGCEALVLGAWGCGVFRNDPTLVAAAFWHHLQPDGPFWGRFQKVLFSVFDTSASQNIYHAFAEFFGG